MRISADLTRTESTKDIKTAESFIHSNSNFTCNIKSSFSNLNFLSKDMENKLGRSNSELKMRIRSNDEVAMSCRISVNESKHNFEQNKFMIMDESKKLENPINRVSSSSKYRAFSSEKLSINSPFISPLKRSQSMMKPEIKVEKEIYMPAKNSLSSSQSFVNFNSSFSLFEAKSKDAMMEPQAEKCKSKIHDSLNSIENFENKAEADISSRSLNPCLSISNVKHLRKSSQNLSFDNLSMNSLKVKKGLSATSKISTEFLEKITYQQQEKAPSSKVIDSVLLKNVNSKQVIAIRNAIELASKSTPNSLHSSPSTTRKLVKKQSTNSLHEASLLKHPFKAPSNNYSNKNSHFCTDELKFETKKLDKKETGMKIDLKDLDTSMKTESSLITSTKQSNFLNEDEKSLSIRNAKEHSLTNLNQHKKGEANDFPSSQLNNINFEVEAMDLLLYQNSSINSNSDVIHDCNNVDNPLNDTDNANLQASIITSPVTTSAFKNHAALSTSPLLDSAFNHTVLGTSETSHAVNAMQLLNEANMLSNHYDADVLESKNIDKDDAAKELLISENLAVTQKYDEGYKESEDFLLETENIKEIKNCMDSYASTDVDVLLKKKKSKNRSQPVLFSIETASWGIFGKLFNKENSYNYRANFTGHPSLEENLTLSSSVDSATLKTSLVSTQKSTSSIHLVDESVLSPTIPTNEDRKSFTATEIVRKSQIGENQENKPGHLIPMTGFYLSEVKSETTISTLKNKSIRILAPLHNGRNKPAIKQNGNPSNSETFLWLQEDISTLKIHKLIESDYKFYVKIMDSLNEVSIKELSYLMEALKCWSASRVISHFKKKKEKSKMKTLLNKMSSNADLKEDTEQSLAASVPNLVSFGEISVYIKENVTSSTTSNNTEIELEISHFLYQCINYIEKNGIESQGIFRVSGGFKRIEMLKDSLKQGEELSLAICTQPHDVATLMKGYFRDLKEPLLTVRLYKPFIKTAYIKDHASKLKLIRILISLLPKSNLHHLYYLLKFLSKVTTYSSKNNMTSSNLAVCFGPNILRSEVTVQAQMHPPEPSDVGQLHHSDKLNYFKNLSPDLKRKSFLDSTGHLSKEKENNADSKINSIMQRKTSALDSGQSKKSIGEVSNIIETVTFLIDNFLELWKIPEFICVKVAAEIDKDKNE